MRNENEFTRASRVAMMLVLTMGLAACAPEEAPEWAPDDIVTEPEPGVAEPLTVDIEGDETSVTGEATVSRIGESVMVSLTVQNLPGEGPFQAHLLSGRCDDRQDLADMGDPATPEPVEPTEPGEQPMDRPTQPGMQQQGQVLSSLENIQVTAQTGTSTSTVPVSQLQGHDRAFIQIEDSAGQPIACGDIDDLGQATLGTGTAPGTDPGTTPRY